MHKAQGDVGVAKQICVDGVHHTCDLETLALKLLIRRDGVAAVGLSQLLGCVFAQRLRRHGHLVRLTLSPDRSLWPCGAALTIGHAEQH